MATAKILLSIYFENVMGIKRVVKETTVTVEDKPLVLVALYLVQYPCKLGLSQRNQKIHPSLL